jgi:hypothetical protein
VVNDCCCFAELDGGIGPEDRWVFFNPGASVLTGVSSGWMANFPSTT